MSAATRMDTERPLPQSTEAEKSCLGAALLDHEAAERAFGIVTPADFFREAHRHIAQAISDVLGRGEPVDLVTVSAELRRTGKLEEYGGGEYLTALLDSLPTTSHVVRYATIVAERSVLRQGIALSAEVAREAYETPQDIGAWALGAADRYARLYQDRAKPQALPQDEQACRFWDTFEDVFATAADGQVVCTGIRGLDEQIGPMDRQRLVVVMGDSKFGKSSFARQITLLTARNCQRTGNGKKVLVLSIEEGEELYRARCVAFLGVLDSMALTIPGWWQRKYGAAPEPLERLTAAQAEFAELPLILHFAPHDLGQACAMIRETARREDLACVVIDYLQNLTVKGHFSGPVEKWAEIVLTLKRLSDELKLPVITPSQVTWDKERGQYNTFGSKEPEKQATLVLVVHRSRDKATNELLAQGHIEVKVSRMTGSIGKTQIESRLAYSMFLEPNDALEVDAATRRQTLWRIVEDASPADEPFEWPNNE